jgi:hypothetical protein
MSVSKLEQTEDLAADERWQLVQRIVSSPPFQRSARLRELLEYLSERTIHGHSHELTEQQIGSTLFHKPSGYSSLEDSSVRVHVRQLRLKLHEYFDEEGRCEPLVLSIPKGSYNPVFRPAAKAAASSQEVLSREGAADVWRKRTLLAFILCGVLLAVCIPLGYEAVRRSAAGSTASIAAPPWPFSEIFDNRHQTIVVVADTNYGMFRILTGKPGSLDQYLRREFPPSTVTLKPGGADTRLSEYISNSALTSFADVANVVSLLDMAGPLRGRVSVRYPRDLGMRDLDHENYVFLGSAGSNPWVYLFQNKLNFRESEAVVGNSAKAFTNTHPLPGEKDRYEGLRWTGTMGEDYATIALVPNMTNDGSVLVLQGLQQEGTEAAGRFLADPENRRQLRNALGVSSASDFPSEKIWFEALIRSRTVAGAPNSTTLVGVRRIR